MHVRLRGPGEKKLLVAKGWIAAGDIAFGALACGPIAVGGISIGAVTIGLLAMGGAAAGALAVGGFGIGGLAFAGCAIGYFAFGGVALAWLAARGGVAAARQFAVGELAFAPHANDEVARAFMRNNILCSHELLIVSCVFLLLTLDALIIWWILFKGKKSARQN